MSMALGVRRWTRVAVLALAALSPSVPTLLRAQEASFDWEAAVRRLEAIEERDPSRLPDLARNGHPTLIAFIDHTCYTCLRSVESVTALRARFAERANVVLIDPLRLTPAHAWAKDHYRVWFVPKFVLLSRRGAVAKEYFGPIPARALAADLEALLAK